ncbi:hypothetical protein EZH22_14420 [Xanthobacter dioxanivorans]|uniref:Uncharacterized protein n=1 Tax=Xanthobacter dioxanivorans TaxID=2528964 RepID=A0A974SM69_9HYPH|nr:hypothetical protein [Xanthobacter dioxanivorans]QRG09338.1 hypothetical protein EZH22_14420 [Xanthobacter dioxanivorans]
MAIDPQFKAGATLVICTAAMCHACGRQIRRAARKDRACRRSTKARKEAV